MWKRTALEEAVILGVGGQPWHTPVLSERPQEAQGRAWVGRPAQRPMHACTHAILVSFKVNTSH